MSSDGCANSSNAQSVSRCSASPSRSFLVSIPFALPVSPSSSPLLSSTLTTKLEDKRNWERKVSNFQKTQSNQNSRAPSTRLWPLLHLLLLNQNLNQSQSQWSKKSKRVRVLCAEGTFRSLSKRASRNLKTTCSSTPFSRGSPNSKASSTEKSTALKVHKRPTKKPSLSLQRRSRDLLRPARSAKEQPRPTQKPCGGAKSAALLSVKNTNPSIPSFLRPKTILSFLSKKPSHLSTKSAMISLLSSRNSDLFLRR